MSQELKDRTKALALRIIRLTEALAPGWTADVIGRQLLRSGTSVAANYRAACRAKSRKDFVAKLGTVEEECDECLFRLELLEEAEVMPGMRLADLRAEADELLSIVVASQKTAREVRQCP